MGELDVIEIDGEQLKLPFCLSFICLPTQHTYMFYVVRIGNYAAIIDTGYRCIAFERIFELLWGSEYLLQGALEIELINTYTDDSYNGYTSELCDVIRSMDGVRFTHIQRDETDWDVIHENSEWDYVRVPSEHMRLGMFPKGRHYGYRCFVRDRIFKTTLFIPHVKSKKSTDYTQEAFAVEFEVPMSDSTKEPFRCLLGGGSSFLNDMLPFTHSMFKSVDCLVQANHGSISYTSVEQYSAIPCDFLFG
ncbi:hypothetical protein PCE1_002304 [Barthelona sp. PCE]